MHAGVPNDGRSHALCAVRRRAPLLRRADLHSYGDGLRDRAGKNQLPPDIVTRNDANTSTVLKLCTKTVTKKPFCKLTT